MYIFPNYDETWALRKTCGRQTLCSAIGVLMQVTRIY